MKQIRIFMMAIILCIGGLSISACGGGKKEASDKMGKEYTSEYVCPMHCEGSGSASPGICPVCGMDYVLRSEHEKDGHNH